MIVSVRACARCDSCVRATHGTMSMHGVRGAHVRVGERCCGTMAIGRRSENFTQSLTHHHDHDTRR